jgi:ATP-dependent Clp endopeptidase proteolytic subunit ClpP
VKTLKKAIWELKQSVEPNTLDMYIYGYIEGDYYDWWNDVVVESETSATHFRTELAKYPNVTQINLYVNSFGGYVYEAMAIRNQLKRHQAHVTAYVDGFAASAASFILTGCDEVKMYSNTMQMIHNAINGAYGNSKDLRKAADDLDRIMDGNRQAYLEKSNGKLTEEKLIELLEVETYLTAKEAFEYGLCDEVISEEKDMTEAKQMLQQVNKTLEQHISYQKALSMQLKEMVETPKEPTQPLEGIPHTEEPPQENKLKQFMLGLSQRKEGK